MDSLPLLRGCRARRPRWRATVNTHTAGSTARLNSPNIRARRYTVIINGVVVVAHLLLMLVLVLLLLLHLSRSDLVHVHVARQANPC